MRHRACVGSVGLVGCVLSCVVFSTFGLVKGARAEGALAATLASESAAPVAVPDLPLGASSPADSNAPAAPVVAPPVVDAPVTMAPAVDAAPAEDPLIDTTAAVDPSDSAPVMAPSEVRHFAPLAPSPAPEADRDERGLLGQARVGLLAGVGLSSRPVNLLALARIHRTVSVGAEYKFLPTVSISDATVSAYSVGGDLRVFPFGGAFFVGASGGYQVLSLASGTGAEAGAITSSSIYATPRVGCLWNWDFGLALGVDVGVTIPIAAQTVVNSPIPLQQIEDTARTLGKAPLPEISLLRIGMLM